MHHYAPPVRERLGAAVGIGAAAVGGWVLMRESVVPSVLEPTPGASQCGYELLRSFARYTEVRLPGFRYTLAAGTLLGAMRNSPPGLLQWEHDVDVYVPASDAARLREALRHDCAREPDLRCGRPNPLHCRMRGPA